MTVKYFFKCVKRLQWEAAASGFLTSIATFLIIIVMNWGQHEDVTPNRLMWDGVTGGFMAFLVCYLILNVRGWWDFLMGRW